MADTKVIRARIKSVNSTLHLTKAMGLVASSKIKRANEAMFKGRAYSDAIEDMITILTSSSECGKSPYMQKRDTGRITLVVIAGDRGMCGGYNANIFRTLRDYPDAKIIPIGKRVHDRYQGEYYSSETYTKDEGYDLAVALCEAFKNGETDRVGIVSSKYISIMSQEAVIDWILPLEKRTAEKNVSILFEPDEQEILNTAVLEYVSGKIMAAVRESFACEVAARRMAMDSAGKNAQQMIYDLQLSYNRARQASITQEITEIVAGAGQ